MLCLFEVTARFYSHSPAPLHHYNTASIQNELEKKGYFVCCCFVLVEQTPSLNFAAANCSCVVWHYCMLDCLLVFLIILPTFSLLVHSEYVLI